MQRIRSGARKITHITEVAGMEGEKVILQDLFRLNGEELVPTGLRPHFMEKLVDSGVELSPTIFVGGGMMGGGARRR